MNNRATFFLLWAVGVLLAASGCVEPVAINPPVEREICCKGILVVGDTTQKVTLLYSGGFGDSVFDPITNAQVTVNDGKLKHYSAVVSNLPKNYQVFLVEVYQILFQLIPGFFE